MLSALVSGVARWSLVLCFAMLRLIQFFVASISCVDLVLIGGHINAMNHWLSYAQDYAYKLSSIRALRPIIERSQDTTVTRIVIKTTANIRFFPCSRTLYGRAS
ncbi:hypothetical protein BDR03DRAFT_37063 [Suillus americanus]|nr:hypothetical protein BDR03DRAFT_37063 [Suillus americanus]